MSPGWRISTTAGWYMVSCNHQSWVDIFVLQHLLNNRIPMLKFVLKRQLIYVPVIGLAWWALDFPFVRRRSDAYLRRTRRSVPRTWKRSRRACEKFALVPTSVMNFAEGTRFTTRSIAPSTRRTAPAEAEGGRARAGAARTG